MKPQNTRPETTKNSRIDRNLVFSPEPQKLYQPLHQTPKPIISSGQSPEKYPPIPFSNPEVLEKELVIPIKPPHFIQFLPFEVFERKFELAIKNKQNKGILPSRKIDIYLNKESLSQNDFYAVKTFECESLDQISRKIQSLMISNHLMNNNDISLKILYYTIDASDKKTKKINFTFILIMELAESNLADEFLRRKAKKTQFSKLEMYTLTEALIILLAKMEKLKIAHGNLKPENVLLVKGRYKFTDFNGTFYERMDFYLPSQHVIATKYIPQGVREKMTEKIIFDINYYKLDVFSLGAMLLECADGEEIEENGGFTEEKIQEKINKVAGRYDSWFINLLQNMLENEENNRVDIDGVCEQIAKYHEEIHKLQIEANKIKKLTSSPKKEVSKTTTVFSKKREENLKQKEKPKGKADIIPRKIPNRSSTPESPLKEMDPESRYSSLEKKKNKNEITHSKVTSYVSPRAQTQKDNNAFKFPIKNEMKKKAKIYKNNEKVIDEIHDNRDLFKEFSEKLNKNIGKQTNFTTLLNHFNIDQLHYNRNIFYQKYMVSNDNKIAKKIVSENKRKDGKIVRFYSDHSQEILFNNGAKKMIFPDSYSIITFLNNDIKQTFPYEMTIYYYADSQTTQITYEKTGINIYQFKNEQLELHHSDGRIEIRLSDGTEKHLLIANNK